MKVLIYGGNGWLASFFKDLFEEKGWNFVIGKSRVDFEHLENLKEEISSQNPTHILSCLGRTHGEGYSTIDYLEEPSKLKDNLKDNLMAPIILGMECSMRDIHFTYIGTGCIFEYSDIFTLENGVVEKDYPNFFGSAYSTTKGFTDSFFKSYLSEKCLVLRIRMPVSKNPHSRNFISKILSYPKVCSIENSVTCIEDLFPYAVDMMENKITGIFNFVNTGTISHSQIIDYYIINTNPTHLVQYTTENKLNIKAKRSNIYLDNSKLCELYPIRTAVDVIMEIMKTFPKIN